MPIAARMTHINMIAPIKYRLGSPQVLGFSGGTSLSRRDAIGAPFSSNSSGWNPEMTVSSSEKGEWGR
jgi:hypothetical protein